MNAAFLLLNSSLFLFFFFFFLTCAFLLLGQMARGLDLQMISKELRNKIKCSKNHLWQIQPYEKKVSREYIFLILSYICIWYILAISKKAVNITSKSIQKNKNTICYKCFCILGTSSHNQESAFNQKSKQGRQEGGSSLSLYQNSLQGAILKKLSTQGFLPL